jgi:hypothetical protein
MSGAASLAVVAGFNQQHFLNFLPEPHGQGSLRPTLAIEVHMRNKFMVVLGRGSDT